MSQEVSASASSSSSSPYVCSENQFESAVPYAFPPPRTPLNSIPDPSQCSNDPRLSENKHKLDGIGTTRHNAASAAAATPKTKTAHSEPTSAHNTPARRSSLYSTTPLHRTSSKTRQQHITSSFTPTTPISADAPQFELHQDPSFWKDHNVQVLIRVRPLNNMERVSQGYGRCLRQESAQSLLWLGHPETRFTFDHVASETISQEKLFRIAGLPMVENCISGYNSCMFAYGQTGSGKTYTMMGDINQVDGTLGDNCGITTRIFHCLFSRIKEEEESRRAENLKFSCKCSFLEIYNEQITDLLEPSSTNLQLREDMKKGVYVENLTEYNVTTVDDVTKLLLQGAANRKISATYMNSESSRSHSVFTCTIESWWEKDSMNHFRFARLNLVDLAGSERQKSSGADGDRLKEAANINKSLSTLGLVIMSLVDLAHGKQRHVPYRDSRLTFLLQDSLGGNSKTTIIANVSPSTCSAHETLSTLKFAQRAKLIQNNAKVNEDASGDVGALQQQIQQLKDQLSSLMKYNGHPRSFSACMPRFGQSRLADLSEIYNFCEDGAATINQDALDLGNKRMKQMEAALVGALRREKMAENVIQELEAEIEKMNQFACQREEEMQHTNMMLTVQLEKIKQMEKLSNGSRPSDHCLLEQNRALKEEIQLLRARIEKIPELTDFALENARLHKQRQLFQSFYEQGEREKLLGEISQLRDQLLDRHERNPIASRYDNQEHDTRKELEACRKLNSQLFREIDELREQVIMYVKRSGQTAFENVTDSYPLDPEEFRHTDKYSLVETVSTASDSGDDVDSHIQEYDAALLYKHGSDVVANSGSIVQPRNSQKELIKTRVLGRAVESEQIESLELEYLRKPDSSSVMNGSDDLKIKSLQAKLDMITKDLEEASLRNCQYQELQESQLAHQRENELVRKEVEMETSRTIIDLQEELMSLKWELNEKLCCMDEENMRLRNAMAAKEEELMMLRKEWERATLELTNFLVEGAKSLKDASSQIESIACSFPQGNVWISEKVVRAARACIDKEETIMQLHESLADAQQMVVDMELKVNSLKEATMALNDFPQADRDDNTEEAFHLRALLNEKNNMLKLLESEVKDKEDHIHEAEKRADAAFVLVKWLSDQYKVSYHNSTERSTRISELVSPTGSDKPFEGSIDAHTWDAEATEAQNELKNLIFESHNAIKTCYRDVEVHMAASQGDILEVSTTYMRLVQELVEETHELRCKTAAVKDHMSSRPSAVKMQGLKPPNSIEPGFLHLIRDEVAKVNDSLKIIHDSFDTKARADCCISTDEYLTETDSWSADSSTSSSSTLGHGIPSKNNFSGDMLDKFLYTCHSKFSSNISKQMVKPKFQKSSVVESEKRLNKFQKHDEVMSFSLRNELDMTFTAFNKLYNRLTRVFNWNDVVDNSGSQDSMDVVRSCVLRQEIADAYCHNAGEVVADKKASHASVFLSNCVEAHATMKEADHMLNALMKANESGKQLNVMWKKASEGLMSERSLLIEENWQLKSSLDLKEGENKLLFDEISLGFIELTNSISLLEGYFLEMQKEMDSYRMLYSDLLSMGREMLYTVCNSRSLLVDVCSEILEKGFACFVFYQCLAAGINHRISSSNVQPHLYPFRSSEHAMASNTLQHSCSSIQDRVLFERDQNEFINLDQKELNPLQHDLVNENLSLRRELERKDVLLKGLFFDFSLLQETASNRKDRKDETQKLVLALNSVRHDLDQKTNQLENLQFQLRQVECQLLDTENALSISNSNLEQAQETSTSLSEQNAELRMLLKDIYLKNSEAEEHLEEYKQVVKGLEEEIIHLTTFAERNSHASAETIEKELAKVTNERDQFCREICSLNDELEMANVLADEKEAISVEARQESEASKLYAEQKEEEVKILENSVEELEYTVNVLEKKVCEMSEEVERHRLMRDSLEMELRCLRHRLSTVENLSDVMDSENREFSNNEHHISRRLELHEAHNQIRLLKNDIADKEKELKQSKEYISELVLHSEAQASQFQEKYKTLEAMIREVKTKLSNSEPETSTWEKSVKSSTRVRGSSSPLRCITNLVQQINLEKDEELTVKKLRIKELETVLTDRQKEVCMLNARLAAAENMTHDVIRDLLGVRLDMTNYANLIDQHQLQKLVEDSHQQMEELREKEQEILNLKNQINDLTKERESCMCEINEKATEILAAHVTIEQLKERDQLLSAHNGMLKMDKSNLLRRNAELDEMAKALLGTHGNQKQIQKVSKDEGKSVLKLGGFDLAQKLSHSERLLSRANNELVQYHRASASHAHVKTNARHRIQTQKVESLT
ncbi:hypothetical protein K2173_022560 [Erythroxylum novogranatense]|uniref:Kinesin motor domain-containing protein n=1 Tax=Erythroxylum novogranatense TaxID=1862640 RepID=A0AAV8TJA1_9ROSI|nr:hypothetical protein K2173_022560 [Erythroxylum novogranatense]